LGTLVYIWANGIKTGLLKKRHVRVWNRFSCLRIRVVKPNQTRKDAAATIWLTYDGRVRECVRPSTAKSSPTSLVKCDDALSFIFVSWTPVIERDGCYLALGNECRTVLSVHDHQAYDASRCEHRNRNYPSGVW
jgi:hypothetical protein